VAAKYGGEVVTLSESRSYNNMNLYRFTFWQRIWRENYYWDKLFKQACLRMPLTLRISVNKICSPTEIGKSYTYLLHLINWKIKGTDKSHNHTSSVSKQGTAFCRTVDVLTLKLAACAGWNERKITDYN